MEQSDYINYSISYLKQSFFITKIQLTTTRKIRYFPILKISSKVFIYQEFVYHVKTNNKSHFYIANN